LRISVGKNALVKNDMPGDNNTAGREIETAVPFLLLWVTKEDATCGPRGKFVVGSSVEFGETHASKSAEVGIGGVATK
jgi:hypothetical protein